MQEVARLRASIEACLRPHVPPGQSVALVHVPSHRNPGDAAITLGAIRVLEHLGARIDYLCSRESYSANRLRARVGDGTIYFNGGGSFGDHYAWEQAFRDRVLADFPSNPVVQLPQSMNFRGGVAMDAARKALDSHVDVTLLLRDHASHEAAREAFGVPTELCPDLAFAWEPPAATGARGDRILCLGRLDSESTGQIHHLVGPELVHSDWPTGAVDALRWPFRRLLSYTAREPRSPLVERTLEQGTRVLLPALSRAAVATATRNLRKYGVVVTDRLHGHILSTLLGIPHVVLGDRDGKVRSYYETWHRDGDPAHFAETSEDALALARTLLEDSTRAAPA